MSSQWVSRTEMLAQANWAAKERQKLLDIILELTAVVDRLNKHGYNDRLLERVYLNTGITAEKVDELNAKKAAKAAEYRAKREAGA